MMCLKQNLHSLTMLELQSVQRMVDWLPLPLTLTQLWYSLMSTVDPNTVATCCTYWVNVPDCTDCCKLLVKEVYKVLASCEKSTKFRDTTTVTVTLILYDSSCMHRLRLCGDGTHRIRRCICNLLNGHITAVDTHWFCSWIYDRLLAALIKSWLSHTWQRKHRGNLNSLFYLERRCNTWHSRRLKSGELRRQPSWSWSCWG